MWRLASGRSVPEPDQGWFNLATQRLNQNPPPDSRALRGHRWVGTVDQLQQHWTRNRSDPIPVIYDPNDLPERLSQMQAQMDLVCARGLAGTIIPTSNGQSADVDSLSLEQMASMCRFTLARLLTKARVVQVIDGDTFDLVVHVPVSVGSSGSSGSSGSVGFFARIRVRAYGYDAAELSTPQGQRAREVMIAVLARIESRVWVQFLEMDKYGRNLALLYADRDRRSPINTYLVRHFPDLAQPYFG